MSQKSQNSRQTLHFHVSICMLPMVSTAVTATYMVFTFPGLLAEVLLRFFFQFEYLVSCQQK